MRTEILRVHPDCPEREAIAQAAAVLRARGLVAFPTETVYGLGANALDVEAVSRIFAAKGRPIHNPLIVHVHRKDDVHLVATGWNEYATRLAERFWPGPLTLVLSRRNGVPDIVTAGGPTVAVRIPAHPVARALIEAAGFPLAAPSANLSSMVSPTCAEHVLRGLDGRIDMILDGGPTAGGLESTVLDVTASPARLLRPGLVSPGEIEAVIGPILRLDGSGEDGVSSPRPSPGMMSRHYTPRAVLECTIDSGRSLVEELCRTGLRVGWLTFDPDEHFTPGVTVVVMPRDPAEYATRLYAELHALDAAGVDRIVAVFPPDEDQWLAARDRLGRASTPR